MYKNEHYKNWIYLFMFGSNTQIKKCVTTTIIIADDILHSGTCTVYLFAFQDETDSIVEHLCFL